MSAIFHKGELHMQQQVGLKPEQRKSIERFIRPYMPKQHRDFFEELKYAYIGVKDKWGRSWASITWGDKLIQSPNEKQLLLNAQILGQEQLALSVSPGDKLGILGLDYSNRRRNRANGSIQTTSSDGYLIDIEQSYGNCPKFIHIREMMALSPSPILKIEHFHNFTEDLSSLLQHTPTFFIATQFDAPDNAHGLDVSHRGGKHGFVRVLSDKMLVFDDYPGNNFFNTFGNLIVNPSAGLLIHNDQNGDIYMLTGRATIGKPVRPKTQFEVSFEIIEGARISGYFPYRWEITSYSPAINSI